MEAALAVVALVATLVLCLAGVGAVSMQVRCVDAAREAALLAARGDEPAAVVVAREIAPAGAAIRVHRDGGFVVATVTVRPRLLSRLGIGGRGAAALESGR